MPSNSLGTVLHTLLVLMALSSTVWVYMELEMAFQEELSKFLKFIMRLEGSVISMEAC